MPSISEIRQKYPQYQDMDDQRLAEAIHKKFYADMPQEEFYGRIGLAPQGQRESSGALEAAAVASGGLIEGIPVIGPYIRKGLDYPAAAGAMMLSDRPVTFNEALKAVRGEQRVQKEKHPYIDTGSQVVGGITGMLPAVAAAPAVFGAGGGGLLANTIAGTLSGGALGAADTGVRSDFDPDAMLQGTAWGAGLGFAGPAAGRAIGKGVNAVANKFRGPSAENAALGRAAMADAIPAEELTARLQKLGPEAMVADLGPNLQRQAGALASLPGRGQEVVRGAIKARDAGANSRILGELDDTLGKAPIPSRISSSISQNKKALSPEYADVFRDARRVDTEPLAHRLEQQAVNLRGEAQKAVQHVRRMLNITGIDALDPNPGTLFQIRQAIDGMLETAADSKAIAALAEARRSVDDILADAVPEIKRVDAKFAELARQDEALTRGSQALESGRAAPRPAELAEEVRLGALPQGGMIGPSAVPFRLSQGARAEIDRIVGTNSNDVVALQRIIKGEGDWNRARLATLFGEGKADRIFNVLERERAFADTSNIVTRNSETAARTAAQKEVAGPQARPGIARSLMNLRFGDAAADGVDRMIGGARTAAQDASNARLAEMLTSRQDNSSRIENIIRSVQRSVERGEITEARARELFISLAAASAAQRKQPLEITVGGKR